LCDIGPDLQSVLENVFMVMTVALINAVERRDCGRNQFQQSGFFQQFQSRDGSFAGAFRKFSLIRR
jgi:hypothetical protein